MLTEHVALHRRGLVELLVDLGEPCVGPFLGFAEQVQLGGKLLGAMVAAGGGVECDFE